MLYYSDGSAVYAFDVNDSALPTTPLINRSFYGLGYNDGYIYGTDAVDCEFDVRHDELNSSLQHYLHFRNFPDLSLLH